MRRLEREGEGKEDKQWKKLVHLNKVENNDKISFYLFNLTVSLFVAFGNKTVFFAINTPILLWRTGYLIKNRQLFSGYDKFFRFQNTLIWLVYHFTFFFLFLSEVRIENEDKMSLSQMSSFKISGYIIIFGILIGGFFDLLDFLISIVGWVI